MRILYWTRVFWPQIGGVEVLAASFLPAMRQLGYEFVVVTSHSSLAMPDQSDFQGIPVYRFEFGSALTNRDLSQVFGITERVARIKQVFNPDLVHVNYWEASLFFHLRTADASLAPLLVSFRGPPPAQDDSRDTVFGHAMRSATWVTAVSKVVLQRVRELMPEITPRSSVIHNGFEPPSLRCAPLCFQPPRLLCVGRLVPEKGFDLALRALVRLVGRFPSVRLTIAGDGPERSRLEGLARELQLTELVEFLGWVAPGQVPQLMNAATVVLIPSRWEGLPGVAIQAAQMARPVVATRIWGIPEVVLDQRTGLLVDEENVSALAEAVAFLLERPEQAAQMGELGWRHAQRTFSWQQYLGAHNTLYQQLIRGGIRADTANALTSE